MFNIAGFLEKFQKNIRDGELSKKEIADAVASCSGVTCPPESLEIKNYILYIDASPTLKNKIFLSKKEILAKLSKLSSVKITDVR